MAAYPNRPVGDCHIGRKHPVFDIAIIYRISYFTPMPRQYNSPLREERAKRTRQVIVAAASRLHAQGITELSAIAQEAGVALATLSKHYPTKDDLFRESAPGIAQALVDLLTTLRAISDRGERLLRAVVRLCAIYEEQMGAVWTSYRLRDESEAIGELVAREERLMLQIAESLAREWSESQPKVHAVALTGYVATLLHPMTYRAMRLFGGISEEAAATRTLGVIAHLLTQRGLDTRSDELDSGEDRETWAPV